MGLIIFVLVVFGIAAIVGNIELLICLFGNGSILPDGQWFLMLIAVLADIALVCYIVYKIKNKQKEKLVEEKQKCIDKFKSEVNDKTKTLQLISSFEKGFDRTDNLMQLLSVLNPLNDDLHNYFDEHTESQYSHEYKKIMSDIPETEKKTVSNHSFRNHRIQKKIKIRKN